jgi:putative phosphoesterase
MAIVGVISDTHGLLREEAIEALRRSDRIIHAGDVGDPEILKKLTTIAPVTAVRGNIDKGELGRKLSKTEWLEIEGVAIYVLHIREELDVSPKAAGVGVVIYGHSHKPEQQMKDGVLYFNPGSAGPRRFKLPVTVGRLVIEDGAVKGELIELEAEA